MPGGDYLTAFACWLSLQRIEQRRSYIVLDGVRAAFQTHIPERFFHALYEDPQEAVFWSRLHRERTAFTMHQHDREMLP